MSYWFYNFLWAIIPELFDMELQGGDEGDFDLCFSLAWISVYLNSVLFCGMIYDLHHVAGTNYPGK